MDATDILEAKQSPKQLSLSLTKRAFDTETQTTVSGVGL